MSIGRKQELVNLSIEPMASLDSSIIESRHSYIMWASCGWEHSVKKFGEPVVHTR